MNAAGDFERLNHRMHNKLLVADGAFAIVGGRNMADEYFLQHAQANFLDFDVLALGPLVAELSQLFDGYWNSRVVWPVQAVARSDAAPAELRAAFERHLMAHDDRRAGPPEADMYGQPPFGRDLAQGLPRLLWAHASACADSPEKTDAAQDAAPADTTVMGRRGLQTLVATHGAYRMTLAADGSGLRWSSVGDAGSDATATPLDDEPEVGWATRLTAKGQPFKGTLD